MLGVQCHGWFITVQGRIICWVVKFWKMNNEHLNFKHLTFAPTFGLESMPHIHIRAGINAPHSGAPHSGRSQCPHIRAAAGWNQCPHIRAGRLESMPHIRAGINAPHSGWNQCPHIRAGINAPRSGWNLCPTFGSG